MKKTVIAALATGALCAAPSFAATAPVEDEANTETVAVELSASELAMLEAEQVETAELEEIEGGQMEDIRLEWIIIGGLVVLAIVAAA
ncbi:MAG: hypothetical protein ABL308_14000 [Oceanicaulis sp.]